ncbi:MAG: hypothetical protein HY721_35595 [Planctomycetes bacterium]|nr:hypothetical protein [Planctomycetota bacterium]
MGRRGRAWAAFAGLFELIWASPAAAQDPNFTDRVPRIPPAAQPTSASFHPRITPDGRFVVLASAQDFAGIGGLPPGVRQIWRWDRTDNTFVLVSRADGATGAPAASSCSRPSICDTGDVVVFDTAAALSDSDLNGTTDIYRRGLSTGSTLRLSAANYACDEGPGPPPGPCRRPSSFGFISGSCQYVAFSSDAPLVSHDGNARRDVYYIAASGANLLLVSLNNQGQQSAYSDLSTFSVQSTSANIERVISYNGELVLFVGVPCDWDSGFGACAGVNCLCPAPNNDCLGCLESTVTPNDQVYVRRILSPETYRVSRQFDGLNYLPANGAARRPSLGKTRTDANEAVIAFSSTATNFTGSGSTKEDIFRIDFALVNDPTGNPALVSIPLSGSTNGDSTYPAVSPDGGFVAFDSLASNLVPSDTNSKKDVFVTDLGTATVRRFSVTSEDQQSTSTGASENPDVADAYDDGAGGENLPGIAVVYESLATDLVANDTNGVRDVFDTPSKPFKRGDANGNGFVQLPDDRDYLLEFLFSGGPAPPCMDAADTNDDGQVNLSDATGIDLNAPCVMDPTDDPLTCATYDCP